MTDQTNSSVCQWFRVVAALTTPNISSLSPSLSYVCISLQLLSLRSLSFLPSVLRSALALPRSRFCVKRGREVEDDWFSAPLATALHCTTLSSIPFLLHDLLHLARSSSLPARRSHSHWPRGPKHTIGSQEAQSDGKTVGLKNLWDENVTEFDITCACKAAYTKRRACGAIVACCHWCAH